MAGIEEKDMNFSQRTRGIVRAFAVVLSLAIPLAMAISTADARVRSIFFLPPEAPLCYTVGVSLRRSP